MAHSATGIVAHSIWPSPPIRFDERQQVKGPSLSLSFGLPAPEPYYQMLGLDTACVSPSLITWVVRGLPDLAGVQIPAEAYACGSTPADVSGIRVLSTWGAVEIVTTEPSSLDDGDGYLVVTDDGEMAVFS